MMEAAAAGSPVGGDKENVTSNIRKSPTKALVQRPRLGELHESSTVPTIVGESKWVPDKERTHCRTCRAEFTRRLRRHHCRISGEVICEGCSVKETVEGKVVRISLRAFKEYALHFDRVKRTTPRVYFGREFGTAEVPKETQIRRCIMFNDVEEFRSLITLTEEVDKKLTADGRRALHFAAQEGCDHIAAYLIQLSVGVNVKDDLGRTALHLAAVHTSDPSMAVNLIAAGASCNVADVNGVTPVHAAAEMSVPVLTELLARVDRDLSARDAQGCEAIHYAARQVDGAVEAVELLLEAGVKVMSTDKAGRTPMHHAAAAGNDAIVTLLFDKGGLLEAKDNEGHTPLLAAAHANQFASAKELLRLGASLHTKDSEGTPFIEIASAVGGLALLAAVEHLGIGLPSDVMLLPAGTTFLKYAVPGTLSSLAGDPRVPQSDRVFTQTVSVHNGSSTETVMFAARYESTFAHVPGRPTVVSEGAYTVSPRYGFIKPKESVTVRIDMRLPTSRMYKEFEADRILIRTAKVNGVGAIDVESERMWSRIPAPQQTRFNLGVKVRAIKPGEKPASEVAAVAADNTLFAL